MCHGTYLQFYLSYFTGHVPSSAFFSYLDLLPSFVASDVFFSINVASDVYLPLSANLVRSDHMMHMARRVDD